MDDMFREDLRAKLIEGISGKLSKDDPRVKTYPDFPKQWINVDALTDFLLPWLEERK